MKRTIRVYKPCDYCLGTGLDESGQYTINCIYCDGRGETIEKVYKEVNMNDVKLPAGRD